eukprot:6470278-Amphidinium_carterae.1
MLRLKFLWKHHRILRLIDSDYSPVSLARDLFVLFLGVQSGVSLFQVTVDMFFKRFFELLYVIIGPELAFARGGSYVIGQYSPNKNDYITDCSVAIRCLRPTRRCSVREMQHNFTLCVDRVRWASETLGFAICKANHARNLSLAGNVLHPRSAWSAPTLQPRKPVLVSKLES